MSSRAVVAVALAALSASCAGEADRAAAREALMRADREFAQATAARRLDGWLAAFAEDGYMLRPNEPVTPGHEEIRRAMAPAFADSTFRLTWEPTLAEVSASGDLGYTVGTYQSTRADSTGHPIVRSGKYLTVWRRQPDGTWKVATDVGVPDTPP